MQEIIEPFLVQQGLELVRPPEIPQSYLDFTPVGRGAGYTSQLILHPNGTSTMFGTIVPTPQTEPFTIGAEDSTAQRSNTGRGTGTIGLPCPRGAANAYIIGTTKH